MPMMVSKSVIVFSIFRRGALVKREEVIPLQIWGKFGFEPRTGHGMGAKISLTSAASFQLNDLTKGIVVLCHTVLL